MCCLLSNYIRSGYGELCATLRHKTKTQHIILVESSYTFPLSATKRKCNIDVHAISASAAEPSQVFALPEGLLKRNYCMDN